MGNCKDSAKHLQAPGPGDAAAGVSGRPSPAGGGREHPGATDPCPLPGAAQPPAPTTSRCVPGLDAHKALSLDFSLPCGHTKAPGKTEVH